MTVLVDVNVFIDVLTRRRNWAGSLQVLRPPRHRFQLVLVQESLHERPVDLLADALSQKMNKIATSPILPR